MLRRHQRLTLAGTVHFATIVTRSRGNWFVAPEICQPLLRLFESYRADTKLDCFGFVLMPDHLHVLLGQSTDGDAVMRCIGNFKKFSSLRLRPTNYPPIRLWRDGYDDMAVPGPDAVRTKLHYMHANPLRRNLVTTAEDYLWSSARYYLHDEPCLITLERPL